MRWRAIAGETEVVQAAPVNVSYAATDLNEATSAVGRLPMLALPRWPVAMQLIPDFAASMTAVQGEAATG
jgi:hypothetical protein